MEKTRVVVTGVGLVTPIGVGVEEFWSAAQSGTSGTGPITHFDPGGLPSRIAASVKDESAICRLRDWLGLSVDEPRVAIFGLAAARMAGGAAGWHSSHPVPGNATRGSLAPGDYKPDRVGIYMGTSGTRVSLARIAEIAYRSRGCNGNGIEAGSYVREYCKSVEGGFVLKLFPQYLAALVGKTYGISGPGCTVQTACTSSAQAVGEALRAVRRGTVDAAVTGGSECIVSPIEMQMFCLLGALSRRNDEPERASRPFDSERDGFVLGEGAGILILERLDRALERGAPILAEMAGYGTSCDAYRVTDEAPDGRGAILAMRRALEDASLSPEEVDYVNAHGTSTLMNDRVETQAIKSVLGERAFRVPVSSTKSMIGHTISAAGAIEVITCVLSLRDQIVPPTINYENPDPECDLDYVPNRARRARICAALSNSFGFGGHNDCLVVRRLEQ